MVDDSNLSLPTGRHLLIACSVISSQREENSTVLTEGSQDLCMQKSRNDQWNILSFIPGKTQRGKCALFSLTILNRMQISSFHLSFWPVLEQIVVGHAQFEATPLSQNGKCCNLSTSLCNGYAESWVSMKVATPAMSVLETLRPDLFPLISAALQEGMR